MMSSSRSTCSRKEYRMEELRKMKARQQARQARATSTFTGISSSMPSSFSVTSSRSKVAGNKKTTMMKKNGAMTSISDAATIAKDPHAAAAAASTIDTSTNFTVDEFDSSSASSSLVKKDWRNHPEVAVLVSDLSGFTSTTRKHGIIHFASVIIRMRQLVLPIFDKYNALEITTEADNFITVFSSCKDCILASIEMRQIIQTYNSTLPLERKHFQIKLNGIGISCSNGGLIMDHDSLLHGKVFEHAYHLGEDICENSDILITQPALDVLRRELPSIQVEEHIADDDDEEELDFQAYRIIFDSTSNALTDTNYSPPKLIDYDDATFLPHQLVPFAKRHDPTIDLQALDHKIKMKHGSKIVTVLMFHFQHQEEQDTENYADPLQCLQNIHLTIQVLRPILTEYNGYECEPELWLFDDPNDAVRAVLHAKLHLREKLQQQQQQQHHHHNDRLLDIEGWGLHQGTLVVVRETDIHWGDPVNTASKLGQDLATNGDLLISDTVYNAIFQKRNNEGDDKKKHHATTTDYWFKNHQVQFEPRQLTCSKVDFAAYCVSASSSLEESTSKSKNSFFRKFRLISIRRLPWSSSKPSPKTKKIKSKRDLHVYDV